MSEPSSSDSGAGRPSVSAVLLAAALTGLVATVASGCGSDPEPAGDSHGSSGGSGGAADAGTYNNLLTADAGAMTVEEFDDLCKQRGGIVYVNAFCAGSSMCKGLSLHDGELYDHSCRAQNSTCSGIGCVSTPPDTGLTGKEIYETKECGNCHADWSGTTDWDHPVVDYTKYAIAYDPLVNTAEEANRRFHDSTDERLLSIIAWGTQGFHESAGYVPYSNMPTYYQKYSRAEIERLVAHVKTLCTFTYPYGVFGQPTPDGGLDPSPTDAGCGK